MDTRDETFSDLDNPASGEPIDIAGEQREQGLEHVQDNGHGVEEEQIDEDEDELDGGEGDEEEYEEGLLGEDDED